MPERDILFQYRGAKITLTTQMGVITNGAEIKLLCIYLFRKAIRKAQKLHTLKGTLSTLIFHSRKAHLREPEAFCSEE